MTIAGKNGGLILKSGALATNCACCAGINYCIRILSSGWSGWFNQDFNTRLASIDPINGDGYGNGLSVSPQLTRPYTVVWFSVFSTTRFSLTIGTTAITATLEPHYSSFPQDKIVMESNEVEAFLNGSVVTISSVTSNTLDLTRWGVDRYGQSAFETIGTFQVRRTSLSLCNCSCSVNVFQGNEPIAYPDTYSLNFTNTAYIPAGPRSDGTTAPLLPFGRGSQKYSAFLPEWPCPDEYLQRLLQPIVMRKVAGATAVWASDPIHIQPCARVRYQFDYCGIFSPRLRVFGINDSGQVASGAGAQVYADDVLCVWNAEEYTENPSSYQGAISQKTYAFGNFATVAPGGEHQPEQQIQCGVPGETLNDMLSLPEGCLGFECPPEEVAVTITGELIPNGTYIVPLTYRACSQASTLRVIYFEEFNVGGGYSLRVRLQRGGTVSGFGFFGADDCPCGSRSLYLSLDLVQSSGAAFPSASTNAPRVPSAEPCRPICLEQGTTVPYNNVGLQYNDGYNPSQFFSVSVVAEF